VNSLNKSVQVIVNGLEGSVQVNMNSLDASVPQLFTITYEIWLGTKSIAHGVKVCNTK
jgi:hypothetical protein